MSVIPLIKYQLPSILAFQVGSSVSAAASVMPNNSGSNWPGIRLAENPPETPAKAAAIPAIGCLPAAAKTTPASGIKTTYAASAARFPSIPINATAGVSR